MPCESCHVQFTVFRRKRSCFDCKRYYCNSCLSSSKRNPHISPLCERCAIFAKRPLLRTDLLQLKPKDLIFYLQSKHISTTGCVEKDELVGLVLNHVHEADVSSPNGNRFHSDTDPTTSFDSLKQTCQNFFSNITENINDSFASFDGKAATKNYNPSPPSTSHSDGPIHIVDQPRVSTREIPTYSSFQNTCIRTQSTHNSSSPIDPSSAHQGPSEAESRSQTASTSTFNHSSQIEVPVVSHSSSTITSHSAVNDDFPERTSTSCEVNENETALSDCECSDEELITTFSERASLRNDTNPHVDLLKDLSHVNNGTSASSTDAGCKAESLSSKLDVVDVEVSSQSSFEELGAIGGISDDSKAATDTNSNNMEQWQILDAKRMENESVIEQPSVSTRDKDIIVAEGLQVALLNSPQQPTVPQRTKKVVRRRSDSYINRRQPIASDDDSPTSNGGAYTQKIDVFTLYEQAEGEEDPAVSAAVHKRRINCQRCGKQKFNLKRKVEKMRRHLESSQMSDSDIKRELQEFLAYLEKRSKSVDCSDTETVASSLSGTNYVATTTPTSTDYMNDNDGIHVYAANASVDDSGKVSRFLNLEDFATLKELENLSVKQLKEVLMLNRVDFKGCCEKQELFERVERLWKTLKTAPAIDKLQTDELCKICMDAPIECVILECGHMATCTNCGKVLSECPICRQYIVRVVRFFRA